jgi:hypothetical protein
MVATFMASLKVAVTTELEHTPVEALGGMTESTVGEVRSRFLQTPHPVTKLMIRNGVNHVLRVFCLCTSLAFPCYIASLEDSGNGSV